MKMAVVDSRIPRPCAEQLRKLGYGLIAMPEFPSLQSPVSAHPDMLLFFADREVLCHKDYLAIAETQIGEIAKCGYDVIVTDENIAPQYPRDVLLNALRIDNKIYCRADSASALILEFARERGYTVRNVKQGYAKCSVCTLGSNAAITSDPTLCRAMREDGIDVLSISAGSVTLPGYDTGFIGGCSGEDGDKIYFSGNISLHSDGARIIEFCEKHKKTAVSLSDEPLTDVGTIFFI